MGDLHTPERPTLRWTSAGSTAREAFKRGLVRDGEVWMDMIEKRNLSSHTYNLAVANTLVLAIAERYYPAFRELQQRFAKEA